MQPRYPGEGEEYPTYEPEAIEESTEEDIESSREMVEEAEVPIEPKKLGTGEKIYLYISSGPGTYSLADPTFDSRIEAGQWAEENYAGAPYQTMTQSEVDAYVAKMQTRQEQVEGIKEDIKDIGAGAKKVAVAGARQTGRGLVRAGRAFTEASSDVAQQSGMTRRQIEPRVRQAWIKPRMQPPAPYQPRGMMPPPSDYAKQPPQPPPAEPQFTKYGRPLKPLQTPRQEPYHPSARPRMSMQPPRPKSRFHMSAESPFAKRKFNIPAEGPFQSRQRPTPETPFKPTRFNFGGGLHMVKPHYVGGRTPGFGRQQPPPELQPVPTLKKRKKAKTSRKSKKKRKYKKKGGKKK